MEESLNGVSDTTQEKPVVGTESDKVAYTTYKKVLGEKKAVAEKVNNLEAELNKYKQAEMESTGKQSELIESLREQLNEKESALKKTNASFAWKAVSSNIKEAAVREGCVNPEKLIKLLDESDLKALEVGEDYKVNPDDLKRLIENAKKEHADIGLFKGSNFKVNDVTPKIVTAKKKNINEMSVAELKAQYMALN